MIVKAFGILRGSALVQPEQRMKPSGAQPLPRAGSLHSLLFAAALGAGVMDPRIAAIMTAIVILSMALTPLVVLPSIASRRRPNLLAMVSKMRTICMAACCSSVSAVSRSWSAKRCWRRTSISRSSD